MYHRVQLGAYWTATQRWTWECLESLLGSVESSRPGVCHRVQLGGSLRSCPGVYWRTYSEVYVGAYSECTWERLESVSQAGWECTSECNQECNSERTWESAKKCIWQFCFKFVECSMMYSIKRTSSHAYHSYLDNVQVHRTS